MLQFVDKEKGGNLQYGIEYFATGLIEADETNNGVGNPSGKDYLVVFISPWGEVKRQWRAVGEIVIAPIECDDAEWLLRVYGTPSSRRMRAGDPDPHDQRYDIERAQLPMGDCSDDEIANGVYMYGNSTPSMNDILLKKAKMPIVYLTAAKERIRWLSRRLEDALASSRRIRKVAAEAGALLREYEQYHVVKGTEDSLAKAERNRRMAEKLESVVTQGSVGD